MVQSIAANETNSCMEGIRLEEQGTCQNKTVVQSKHPNVGDKVEGNEESPTTVGINQKYVTVLSELN